MAVEILIIGALAALAAFAVATYTPRLAFGIIWTRRIAIGLLALVGAIILISTNEFELMIVGGLVIFIIALVLFVEQPQEAVW